MKEREILHLNTHKGNAKILKPLRLLPVIKLEKDKSARARNYFECAGLI